MRPPVLLALGSSGAAGATWSRCPGGMIWDNCPDLHNTGAGTVEACEAACLATAGCTAINYSPGACALRACPNGTEPGWADPGFVGWATYPLRCPAPTAAPTPAPPAAFRWGNTQTDGMVLQAAPQRSIVWGFVGSAATAVSVCLGGAVCVDAALSAAPASAAGGGQVFTATLAAVPPSAAPRNVSATAAGGTAAPAAVIWLRDVVFGDVYVCSGQSNMDFAVPMGLNASAEGEAADGFPDIRLFTVQKCRGGGPHTCADTGPGIELQNSSFTGHRWVPASKDTVYGRDPWTKDKYGGWEAKIGQVDGGEGFSAACWFFGRDLYKRRGYPIGLVWSSIGGSPNQMWMPPQAFTACGQSPRGALGWDVMIAPLLKSVIAGVVWYQGESNENDPLLYNCTFPAMIAAWRGEWANATGGATDPLFPFGFAQLSVHGGPACYGGTACYNMPTWSKGYAPVRWAQTASVGTVPNAALPNVFMATAVDTGEPRTPAGGPHVRDKQDVGARLAFAFRDNFIAGDGPFYTPGAVAAAAAAAGGGAVTVTFANLPPGGQPLLPPTSALGLEVSGDAAWDTPRWVNATSASVAGNALTVTSSLPGAVAQVRYLWSDNACEGWDSDTSTRETDPRYRCPLYTSGGLPVLPFILNATGAGRH